MAKSRFSLKAPIFNGARKNRATFKAWTKSDVFRAAHHRAGDNRPLYLGHPQFEGFETMQTVRGAKPEVA